MASLKPWYRVEGCQPREDLRNNKVLNEADFAVNLDHIRRGEAHPDYVKPHLFFARTFLTKSLRELAAGVVRRLSGETSNTAAVYNMATQFGGGKTHALATLYHLADGGPAARSWTGVDSILVEAEVASVPKAAAAVVVGTEFDPLTGRQDGNGPVRRTLWGEVAWQLGREKSFAIVAEHEAKGVAPAGDVIRAMLPDGPCLILLDEVVNYVGRSRKAGGSDQVYDFLQNLSETVRARTNVVLCVSIPKSLTTEITPEDEEDYTRLKHVLDRLGKAIMMSADLEISEIIRRRLFEWNGLPPEGELAAREYAAWVTDNAGAMTGIDAQHAYEQFKAAYPFHPSTLSVFQRKWQSITRFQRTRGVLRLLAMWVARAFQEDHRKQFPDAVIGLGSAPLDDPKFRAALFEQLGSDNMEGPATTDIAGSSNAHSVRLDKESTDAIKRARLHQKAATTIFFESNGGQVKAETSLQDAIWRGYRHVYFLGTQSELRQVDLGIVTRSQTGSPVEYLLTRLSTDEVITSAPSPRKLVQWWPPALTAWPTKAVRDAFFSSPGLPRLKQPDLIKRTIAGGAAAGDFGYARKTVGNKLDLVAFNKPLADTDVELSDDVVILPAEEARKLLEPPRLARSTPRGRVQRSRLVACTR